MMITLPEILDIVSERSGVSADDVTSERTTRRACLPRHVFCWLARNYTAQSLPEIGRFLGRHYTSILAGEKRIDRMIAIGEMVEPIIEGHVRLAPHRPVKVPRFYIAMPPKLPKPKKPKKETRGPYVSRWTDEAKAELYQFRVIEGWSLDDMAEHFGCSQKAIVAQVKRMGLKGIKGVRPVEEPKPVAKPRPAFTARPRPAVKRPGDRDMAYRTDPDLMGRLRRAATPLLGAHGNELAVAAMLGVHVDTVRSALGRGA